MGRGWTRKCSQGPRNWSEAAKRRGTLRTIMEDTQAIDWDVEEEEEADQSSDSIGCSLEPMGRLHIFSCPHGPEKDFLLYFGKNMVGRMPDCSVALPFPSISKQHAVIEIVGWDKPPVLQDCGSLNGTQILRPPKVLSPGVNYRLKDQDLIVFADVPCQYHRLAVPLSVVSRGPLTVEETPRVQEGAQPQRLLLAEDSEEEVDSLSERCAVKQSKTTSSRLSMVVPESDEEESSPARGGPRSPFAFNLNSDTDEDETQQPPAGEATSAVRRGTTADVHREADRVAAEIQLKEAQPSAKEQDSDTKAKRDARHGAVPVEAVVERSQPPGEDSDTDVEGGSRSPGRPAEVHVERAQPGGLIDSDTDVEEEGIPATPAVVPMKKRQIFHGVGTRNPGLAPLQERQAGDDPDVKEGRAPLVVPLERSHTSVVINSDTDDEEEVSAALTLACLRESRAVLWNRGTDVDENRAHSAVPLEQNQGTPGRESDTDVEEDGLPMQMREMVCRRHTDKDGACVAAHSEQRPPALGDSAVNREAGMSSAGSHLERSPASTAGDSHTAVGVEAPPGPGVTPLYKHQVSVEETDQTDVEVRCAPPELPVMPLERARPCPDGDCKTDVEEGTPLATSAAAGLREKLPEWAAAVLEQERALEVGAQGGSPVAQVERDLIPVSRESPTELVVDTSTPGGPAQPQREGAQTPTGREREPHVGGTKDSEDSRDDFEDLDLQATQCFVERENGSPEAQSTEDEPTQAFLSTLPEEPGPSHCSVQTPGTLDEPWEVLATQPFSPRDSEGSETQPIAAYLEAHGSHPSSPTAAPSDQPAESPIHKESLELHGRGGQIAEKDRGTPETVEKVTPEKRLLERETKKLPPKGEREVKAEKGLSKRMQSRKRKRELATDTRRPEADEKVESSSHEKARESLKVETETKGIQEKEMETQTLAREVCERDVEKAVPKRERAPPGLDVTVPKVIPETGEGSQGQQRQASSPVPEPEVEAEDPQGTASGSQSGGRRGGPVRPRRQQRGRRNCKAPPATKASRGAQGPPDACLPSTVAEASAPPPGPLISQSQEHPAPQSVSSPPSFKPPISRTRQNESQEAPETCSSSALEPFHPTPQVRARVTPSPVPHSTPTDQPVPPEPTPRATQGRTQRSSAQTPDPGEPTAPELQPSTSKDQPVTPELTSQAAQGRTRRSSVKTPDPVEPTALSTPSDQPVPPEPTPRATRRRTQRSSAQTPDPVVPAAPELQPSTSKDQPVTPEPTPRATRGRTRRSSVKTPDPGEPTTPELQLSVSKDQPVTPEPTPRATRGRTYRSSVKTPEPVVPTVSELQPSISKDQSVTPEPTPRATRGRTQRSSAKTPEPVVPAAPELQPSTPTGQPVTPEPTPRATRGRTQRSSAKTPEPAVPTVPELQPPTPTDQPGIPKPIPGETQRRVQRSSVKTPDLVESTASELQPSSSRDEPVTPEPTSQGRTQRPSAKTPDPVVLAAPELQPPTPTDQPVTTEPTPRAMRGRTRRSAVRTPEPVVPVVPELQPSTPTDCPVPEAVAQPAAVSTALVPATPESRSPTATDQPVPQTSRSRRQRAPGKPGSLTDPTARNSCSTHPQPEPRASRSQRRGAMRAAESRRPMAEPTFPQPLEVPTHTPQVQKVEAAGRVRVTPEPQPKATQHRKRSLATADSPPLQKRPQCEEVPQKTAGLEEEDAAERPGKEEGVVIPGPGKRKRDQAEQEPKSIPSRGLRRTKPDQEPTVPKVLFTGVLDTRGERAVLALGGSLAESVAEASHLVTDRIRRTVKFLCALGRGIPILSLDWLHQSRKAGCFLPPDEYVVTDPEQEKNFGFSLREALRRARERRLLEGYEIHVTPGVQPPPPQMREIICCCGGTVLPSMPRSYKPQRVVITCPQDLPRCAIPVRLGLPLLSPEFLLTGVLRQEARPEAFTLSNVEMPST
ncbi:mediator of DNA damage checkpoint protein 1 isoform X2 [Tupaia chinensis]|uniref:mediator of DNA damage checkpoint protein 1 isoform X2 n=1 Tax=Tupaia chinensis TaxID=246437 RepID=UPI000703C73F|nr:mediator of DNA damage checkpoint protein 1 isoform X2 [Tupaia chinensis]